MNANPDPSPNPNPTQGKAGLKDAMKEGEPVPKAEDADEVREEETLTLALT